MIYTSNSYYGKTARSKKARVLILPFRNLNKQAFLVDIFSLNSSFSISNFGDLRQSLGTKQQS